jgi:hypothetical protein
MSLRSRMRDDFPQGWWHSARWWFTGTKELALATVASVATVLFIGEVRRAVRERNDPRVLMSLRATTEGYAAGLVVGCSFFMIMPQMLQAITTSAPQLTPPTALVVILGAWFATNVVLCLIVLCILLHSRFRHRAAWEEREFIEQNAPKFGRPPETIDEYRALGLRQHEEGESRPDAQTEGR